jgi:hypothetical protein
MSSRTVPCSQTEISGWMTISCQLQASGNSWKVVVQLEEHDWILADAIINLSFVILEEDICSSHCYDDCRGMCNFFVLKYQYRGICVLPFQEEWKVFVSTGLSITLNSSSIAYDRMDVLCKNYCVALLSHKLCCGTANLLLQMSQFRFSEVWAFAYMHLMKE